MHRAIIICSAVLLCVAPLNAEQRHYFAPALGISNSGELGLALLNPGAYELSMTVTAHDYTGAVISGANITNPAELRLAASSQKALRTSELFGAGIRGKTGWLEIAASAEVKGFFLLFDEGLTFIDGAELLEQPSRRLVIPSIIQAGVVEGAITFVNTTSQRL